MLVETDSKCIIFAICYSIAANIRIFGFLGPNLLELDWFLCSYVLQGSGCISFYKAKDGIEFY